MDLFQSDQFARHVNDLISRWHIPGLGIAVINDSEIFPRGFGQAVLGPQEIEVTPDTLFDCASTSKSFTAAAVSLLVADDKQYPQVQWTTPVSDLLPDDFVLPDAYATANTTVEDILSHRTGMPGHDYSYLGIKSKAPDTPKLVMRNFRNLPLSKPLRTTYQYCNMMFTAATYLVEQLSNQPFADFLHSHLFDVFNMTSTFLQPSTVYAAGQDGRFAKPYTWLDNKYQELEHFEQPEGQGAGSLQSSVADYAKWIRAMIQRIGPISEEIYSELVKPRIVSNPDAGEDGNLAPFTSHTLYALGWEIEFYRGHKIIRHDGLVSSFGSLILFVPDQRFWLVVFGNAGTANDISSVLAMELVDSLLGVPQAEKINWVQRAENERDTDKRNDDQNLKNLREELCLGSEHGYNQMLPLDTYLGTFNNAGYHSLDVINKNGTLYIDGTDRSMAFTITLEHVCDDKNFLAHFIDDEGSDSAIKAQFHFENSKINAIGLALAEELGESLVWFEKQ